MNRRDEVVFDLSRLLQIHPDSNTRQRQSLVPKPRTIPDGAKTPSLACLPNRSQSCVADSRRDSFDIAIAAKTSLSPADSAIGPTVARGATEANTKVRCSSNSVHTRSTDERNIWLEISNSCAAIAGSPSLLPPRIRSSSANGGIRRLSAAKHAARPRNQNNRAVVVTSEAPHKAQP